MTPRETLIAYLLMKLEQNDLHAVCDAAMDLRDIEAEERGAQKAAEENRKSGEAIRALQGFQLPSGVRCVQHDWRYQASTDDEMCVMCLAHRPVAGRAEKYAAPV